MVKSDLFTTTYVIDSHDATQGCFQKALTSITSVDTSILTNLDPESSGVCPADQKVRGLWVQY